MTLNDFPLIARAFKEIEFDSGGVMSRTLNLDTDIPQHWEHAFQVVEKIFAKLGEGTFGSLYAPLQEALKAEVLDDVYEAKTPLWEIVALPINDAHVVLMDGLGINKTDQWLTNHLLYQFFDGELAGVFTNKRRN